MENILYKVGSLRLLGKPLRAINVFHEDSKILKFFLAYGRYIPGLVVERCRVGKDVKSFSKIFFRR